LLKIISEDQAFLDDHLNDFFPSPSQEIRELRNNVNSQLPSKAVESGCSATHKPLDNYFFQDIQKLLEGIKNLPTGKQILAALQPATASKPAPSIQQDLAFLEDHLDDFFLSSGQEIRELRDDVDGLQPVTAPKPAPSIQQDLAFLEDHLDDFFPSSCQEIRELRDDVDGLQPVTAPKPAPSIQQELAFLEDHLDDFFEGINDMSTDTQITREL
jgi:hypothetical protein